MDRLLTRAVEASRSSKRVALKERLDYVEVIRDIAAMANSGGGVVVLDGIAGVDEELIHEQLAEYAEPEFEGFSLERITREGRPSTAIVVEGAVGSPLVFSKQGRARDGIAFAQGGLYFRHGGKSEPAARPDVRDFINPQLAATRTQWLRNIPAAVHPPGGAEGGGG